MDSKEEWRGWGYNLSSLKRSLVTASFGVYPLKCLVDTPMGLVINKQANASSGGYQHSQSTIQTSYPKRQSALATSRWTLHSGPRLSFPHSRQRSSKTRHHCNGLNRNGPHCRASWNWPCLVTLRGMRHRFFRLESAVPGTLWAFKFLRNWGTPLVNEAFRPPVYLCVP